MTSTADADRRELAAYLAAHGTTRGETVRADLGWDAGRFWRAAYWPVGGRFEVTPEGWRLTEPVAPAKPGHAGRASRRRAPTGRG